MEFTIRTITEEDYDEVFALWDSTPETRRALNPVEDSRESFTRYVRRNPATCFAAVREGKIVGVILSGHDGRRGLIHHLCVHPDCRRQGVAGRLVTEAEEGLKKEGIQKVLCLVYKDNDPAGAFWEKQGFTVRKNIDYRNKSLHPLVPTGE